MAKQAGAANGGFFSSARFTILDGALGTMLQQVGLAPGEKPERFIFEQPEKLTAIHRAYVDAGANDIMANTFGANAKKLAGSGYAPADTVARAVACAKAATAGTTCRVALDVGPLGELMAPGGSLSFEEAYAAFAEEMVAGEEAGADFVMIETMTDLLEVKAAVLAAKENTALPVAVSMTFEPNGRTFAGVPVGAMAAVLPGLGVEALGINCSLAPVDIMPMVQTLCETSPVPVFVMPNAGLPDPATGEYSLSPEEFCKQMMPCMFLGVAAVGGCCGTTPETIRLLAEAFGGQAPAARSVKTRSLFASGTRVVEVNGVLPIGERINPTGKKALQAALAKGDLGHIQKLAAEQEQSGAALLDVNVGAPGVDEVDLLPRAVQAVQAVCGLPLVLDSANPKALEAALRVYNGKPLVNSTSGEAAKLAAVLPLVAKYGAAVVGLAMDDAGIPETAEGRAEVAAKILAEAQKLGVGPWDVYIDCLTLAASAGDVPATETIRAVHLCKQLYGCRTVLGVSNVSFGLPRRPLVNAQFLAMGLTVGLDLAIVNPGVREMMDTIDVHRLLSGADAGGQGFCAKAVEYAAEEAAKAPVPSAMPPASTPASAPAHGGKENTNGAGQAAGARGGEAADTDGGGTPHGTLLRGAVFAGLKDEAALHTKALLEEGQNGVDILGAYMVPALDDVGRGFEDGSLFLPQLMASAMAAEAAFSAVKAHYGTGGDEGEPVVVATVQGDVHDIGKNIAKALLENYGFKVIDLGRDVPPDKVVAAVKTSGAKLCGLSALMTTTLPAMEETIRLLRAQCPGVKVMVGGAVLTAEYAETIGADYYVKSATASVDAAKAVYAK